MNKEEYAIKLSAMIDDQLVDECEHLITLSAYAAMTPRSDYHWQADTCYDECQKRGKVYLYERAFKRAAQN